MTDSIVPPGSPGIQPRWTSSAKSAVGTAAGAESKIWFTISHGVLNEVYTPRLDTACIRDFGLIVTANDYFSEEKRDADHTVVLIEDGVPAFRLVNTSRDGRYRITKSVLSDPDRAVLQAYGAYGEKTMYGRTSVGVIRSTFVIDADGKIEQARYGVKATGHVGRLRQELGV